MVVGGGDVAVRRVSALLAAEAQVTVISPAMHESLQNQQGVTLIPRKYQPGDLAGALLVVIATDDPAVNAAVAGEAKAQHALVNRADAPEESDLVIPSHAHHGHVTVAVHTHGVSASAAATIRRELSASLRPHWQPLLEAAATWRSRIQQAISDPDDRHHRLVALTSPEAITIFQTRGAEALADYYAQLADPAIPFPTKGGSA